MGKPVAGEVVSYSGFHKLTSSRESVGPHWSS